MPKIVSRILSLIKIGITSLLPYLVLFVCFQRISGAPAALILTIVLVVYACATAVSYYGRSKLLCLHTQNAITTKKLFLLCALIASPIFLFWFLFSIIPIPSYESWLMTGLPVIIVSAIPLYSISDDWKHSLKKFFWGLQIFTYVLLFFAGQALGDLLLH